MYRKTKAEDQKAIDLKFLSINEKQSHDIPGKRNTHKLQVRGRKQNREAFKESKPENLKHGKSSYTGSKPIAFQILGREEVQERFQSKTKAQANGKKRKTKAKGTRFKAKNISIRLKVIAKHKSKSKSQKQKNQKRRQMFKAKKKKSEMSDRLGKSLRRFER